MLRKLGTACAIGVFAFTTMGQESCSTGDGGGGKNGGKRGLLSSGATGESGHSNGGVFGNDGDGSDSGGNLSDGGDDSSASSGGGGGCTPGYDPCLPPASDYDCSGGTGDGPEYTGYVQISGSDPYDLDSDGDGSGCD